jgi:hypothetical protein
MAFLVVGRVNGAGYGPGGSGPKVSPRACDLQTPTIVAGTARAPLRQPIHPAAVAGEVSPVRRADEALIHLTAPCRREARGAGPDGVAAGGLRPCRRFLGSGTISGPK